MKRVSLDMNAGKESRAKNAERQQQRLSRLDEFEIRRALLSGGARVESDSGSDDESCSVATSCSSNGDSYGDGKRARTTFYETSRCKIRAFREFASEIVDSLREQSDVLRSVIELGYTVFDEDTINYDDNDNDDNDESDDEGKESENEARGVKRGCDGNVNGESKTKCAKTCTSPTDSLKSFERMERETIARNERPRNC